MGEAAVSTATDLGELEQYRSQLTSYCYRMLGSPFDAEDAVQDALVRAWRSRDRFEGRSALRSWLYRIATNVCLDMIKSRQRRIRPMALGPAQEPIEKNLNVRPEATWLEPIPIQLVAPDPDPADVAIEKESIRLALVAAMQHLPAKQRAVLILREVLRLEASEVAQLLDTTVQSVNSALQRARATLAKSNVSMTDPAPRLNDSDRVMLERYVSAFERYDLSALTALIREDATQSMPPYDMWLSGRDDIMTWWFGPGIGCKGSRVLAAISANGMPTFGQYKIDPNGGYAPWALQVLDLKDGKIADITFFLGTERLFPLFGLPLHLDS
ncbi:MAG: sigma-70 family RNA polymerase sigma factor [Chloroflexi bacterium]|nr:MAG: sigma-70 family RNA polymerase sigma factor [Chloroflexota bacterium]TMG28133.1 MAG: sigma-70 family RNA polymerase sigma factor [Chloroflexota bacterium]